MAEMTNIRQRHTYLMKRNIEVIEHVLANVSQAQATTYRDGDEGWTTLEVLCHLRDFDEIFLSRARMMLEQDYPQLPAYDHEAMAIEDAYNDQDLAEVLASFQASRRESIAFFRNLSDDEWARSGVHPEKGHFTMTDAVMQVGIHDVTHLEQMTRILFKQAGAIS